MINGLEGIPGSGKSYEAVVFHVLDALKQGRKVITNLPLNVDAFTAIDPAYRDLIEIRTRPAKRIGDWDATDIAVRPAFQLWQDKPAEEPPENVFTFGTVWDFYTTWRSAAGQGPLFVIDECHVSFPKIGTPDSVVQWFKLHRHFNADVLLMTQSFRDINQPIAQLLAMLVKVRKADILGKADYYIRKVHAGYRGAQIQQDQRKYESQYFGLYKSNTQSNASSEAAAQDVTPMIVAFNRWKYAIMAVTVGLFVWAFWPKQGYTWYGTRTKEPIVATAKKPSMPVITADEYNRLKASENGQKLPTMHAKPEPESKPEQKPQTVDPLFGKLVHLTGEISKAGRVQQTFIVSSAGRRVFDLTSDDLIDAGYTVEVKGPCMAFVRYQDVVRPVTCDAPFYGGTVNKPIVIDTATKRRSDS